MSSPPGRERLLVAQIIRCFVHIKSRGVIGGTLKGTERYCRIIDESSPANLVGLRFGRHNKYIL